MGRDIRLTVRLMQDPRTPFYLKLLVILAIVYFVMPMDLLPDYFIPGVGYIDDFVIMSWAIRLFLKRVPEYLKKEYRGF